MKAARDDNGNCTFNYSLAVAWGMCVTIYRFLYVVEKCIISYRRWNIQTVTSLWYSLKILALQCHHLFYNSTRANNCLAWNTKRKQIHRDKVIIKCQFEFMSNKQKKVILLVVILPIPYFIRIWMTSYTL